MKKQDIDTISVVIPVFNVKDYIDECMHSILHQSYENLEVILVDDGSSDGSSKICDDYAQKDKRIKVIHQENQGVSFARNAGLRVATGAYIAFIDSDDVVVKDYFKILKDSIQKIGVDLIKCDIDRFVNIEDTVLDGVSLGKTIVKNPKQDLIDVLYCKGVGKWSGPGAKLYKADILDNMQFDTTLAYDEDFDFLCRAIQKSKNIGTIKVKAYMYRVRPGSAMQSGFKLRMLDSIEKRIKLIDMDTDIARAQKTNILLNAMYRFALIPTDTIKFGIERDRLWDIIVELRQSSILDPFQRFDHKASAIVSYFGKKNLGRVVRTAKRIRLSPEL